MYKNIFNEIVDKELCSGCGACAAVDARALHMGWNEEGFFQPIRNKGFKGVLSPETYEVCPFNNDGPDEDHLSEILYGDVIGIKKDEYIGYYLKCFAGHCYDEETRLKRTSGGIIYKVLSFMLSEGTVERVFAVGSNVCEDSLVGFRSFGSPEELECLAKSSYYPTEMSKVLREIIDNRVTACFVGLPCQVKGVRRVLLKYPDLAKKVRFTISLFCGHQKSRYYTWYLARHVGVDPSSILAVDFRRKRQGYVVGDYGFEITCKINGDLVKKNGVMRDVYASSWSNNLFMNPACEFCDDMVGETSDMSVGDAWLAENAQDFRGTSIITVRNPKLLNILERYSNKKLIKLEEAGPGHIYRSQEGGIRQKREGLRYRLALLKNQKKIPPVKRVKPSLKCVTFFDRIQQRLRIELRKRSNRFYSCQLANSGLKIFRRKFKVLILFSQIIAFMRKIERRFISLIRRGF